MRKNTRVQMKGTKDKGTILDNPYRCVVSQERYVDVIFDETNEIAAVMISSLEEIK